jgi:endonuclease YncB( thermonuclease family)
MRLAAAVIAVLLLACTSVAHAREVHIIDGDTLSVDNQSIRLFGMDAPEAGQSCRKPGGGSWPCGQEAIRAMELAVSEGELSCDYRGLDVYGRRLAVCAIGDTDLSDWMVREGHAWAFRRYSLDYVSAEDEAREAGRGVWQMESEAPWEYRQHRWDVALQKAPEGCPIKGNINRKGERIYHAPWSPWYSKTKVSLENGERWFCDEGEALKAGWRAPFWGR